jgi:hypothetical protein
MYQLKQPREQEPVQANPQYSRRLKHMLLLVVLSCVPRPFVRGLDKLDIDIDIDIDVAVEVRETAS